MLETKEQQIHDSADHPIADGAEPTSLTPAQKASIRVLVVDDEESLCESCGNLLEHMGYDVTLETRGDEALEKIERRDFDIILVDLFMRQVSGMELLEAALEADPATLVLVITGKPSLDTSLVALQKGAWDYLPKPFSASHIEVLVGRAAHTVIVGRETDRLREKLEDEHGHSDKITLLGVSAPFRKVIDLARRVAKTDASVFLSGESGTGKELVAQFVHHHSRRGSRNMVAVNCAALPEALLESEMFGHVEGAFTGAIRDKPGLLEEASGGTLFLDELTEMPGPVQAKLLRVIQDGVVRRVGSTETDAVVNVRFIAATNRDPEKAIEEGDLREDLYYRLRVVPIRIPPLRERPEDIPVLARHFLSRAWEKHRKDEEDAPRLTDAAVRTLQTRSWPGNVRELENVIEHAVVLLEPGCDILPGDIPRFDQNGEDSNVVESGIRFLSSEVMDLKYHQARDRLLAQFERRYLEWVVQEADGNMSEAARIASVDRTTLYRLMDKHDLTRDNLESDEPDEE